MEVNQRTMPKNSTMIYDGMVILQQFGGVQLATFGDLSSFVLKRITKNEAKNVYFCTDLYPPDSIKGYERAKRSQSGILRLHLQRRDQKIPKQWSKYLHSAENKLDLVQFLLRDWCENIHTQVISNKNIYVTVSTKFFRLYVGESQVF